MLLFTDGTTNVGREAKRMAELKKEQCNVKKELTLEEKLEELNNQKFLLQMIDRWSNADRIALDKVNKAIREIEKILK